MFADDQRDVAAELFSDFLDQDSVAADDFAPDSLPDAEPGQSDRGSENGTHLVDATAESEQRRDNASMKRRLKRSLTTIGDLRQRLKDASNPCRSSPIERSHASGCLLVALARNQGHTSASATAQWSKLLVGEKLKKSMSRYSVCRWEEVAGTCLIAATASFHHRHEASGGWNTAFVFSEGDATKSAAWRADKLQCMHLVSVYGHSNTEQMDMHEVWPDIQTVTDSTAIGCALLTLKQYRLTQCPVMDECAYRSLLPHQKRWLTQTGDCGSDQRGMRSGLSFKFLEFLRYIYTGFPCMAHQASLGDCRVVALVDEVAKFWHYSFTYYATLTKVVNLFRGEPELIHKAAVLLAGGSYADPRSKQARKKVARCSTGRWTSVIRVEQYFLGFDSDDFVRKIMDLVGLLQSERIAPFQTVHLLSVAYPSVSFEACYRCSSAGTWPPSLAGTRSWIHRRHRW